MILCPKCGEDNREQAELCAHCGLPLSSAATGAPYLLSMATMLLGAPPPSRAPEVGRRLDERKRTSDVRPARNRVNS
jgi:hypothetical protein